MENKNLDALLFGTVNNNTDASYQNTMEFYILPNCDTQKVNSNILYEKISDSSIKSKIMKINSSIKSFNIILKSKNNFNDLNPNSIDTFLSSDHNKNYFINYLLELIIDFIWKIKEENLQRDTLVEKINILNASKDEMEKKIKKLSLELGDERKEFKKIYNKNEIDKEKFDKNKKNQVGEVIYIKNENKKLNNMNNLLKSEIKKKEHEYTKLQEKHKKVLGMGSANVANVNKNQQFIIDQNISPNGDKSTFFAKSISEFNQEKFNLLLNQNLCLFNILRSFQNFLEKFSVNCNSVLEKRGINHIKYFMNLIQIKDKLFSIHLLEKNLLGNFYDQYLTNLDKFEEMVKYILDLVNGNSGSVSANKSASKCLVTSDKKVIMPFDFKNIVMKVPLNNPNPNVSINHNNNDYSIKSMKNSFDIPSKSKLSSYKQNYQMIKNFKRWSLNMNNNKESHITTSKWFDNIENPKEIKFEYDENTVIKYDSNYEMN